jgi:hypothetical protein
LAPATPGGISTWKPTAGWGEFKFINWRGGAEAIRQNSIFKDFFLLAEHPTPKAKFLYVIGTHHPLKFLQGGRSIDSVVSKDQRIRKMFYERYPTGVERVRDYYGLRMDDVTIVDVSPWLPRAEGRGRRLKSLTASSSSQLDGGLRASRSHPKNDPSPCGPGGSRRRQRALSGHRPE